LACSRDSSLSRVLSWNPKATGYFAVDCIFDSVKMMALLAGVCGGTGGADEGNELVMLHTA
jgi:hypothetical protein